MADNDDFDDEELLLVTGRGKQGKKRNRKADDSEDEDERPARQQKPSAKRRSAAAAAAADSDDDGSDSMDEEERAKLEGMNELEREMYLFEREEILQRQRERKAVLSQARSKDAEQVEVRASSRRPRAQTGTDSAIGRIAAAHAEREERAKKKQQQEEEKQEKAERRRKQQEEEEEEEEASAEEADEEMEAESDELQELEEESEEDEQAAPASQLGARGEAFDEGTGYEESEELATLDEVNSITLKRSDLEAWFNEPFFEEDVRGCLLRIVNSQEQARTGQPSYLLARIADIVMRNSYQFPASHKTSRTRKWLHMDDFSGGGVFRHQMQMVSNSAVTKSEYDKALAKAQRGHTKFVTRGDVHAALERLKHARNFKYNPELVKQRLDKKRAAGKLIGSVAEQRARLTHELQVAQQEGKTDEEVQKIQEELERIEQHERMRSQQTDELIQQARGDRDPMAAAKLPADAALAMINMRNRDRNNLKIIQGPMPGAAAKAKQREGADVFSRRHTQSKVYWATGKELKEKEQQAQGGPAGDGGLQRQGSSGIDLSLLKGSLKKLQPSELIKVLELNIDLERLPPPGQVTAALLPKRLLGLRWLQSVEKRQQEMVGRSLLTLDDWKRKMVYTQQLM